MTARRRFDDGERRRRLVARHHLGRTAPDVATAAASLVAVHSSDPVTPHLALRARVPGFATADLDRALHVDRTLRRVHAMRRTLFVVPVGLLGVLDAACGAKVARAERAKLERWVAASLGVADPRPWLADVEARTLAALAAGGLHRTQDLAAAVDGLELRLTVGSGRWTGDVPLASRLLFQLALEGHVVRADPAGSWVSSQYRWAHATTWGEAHVGTVPEPVAARRRLARSWLRAHGPATAEDLRWWAGWTVKEAAAALADAGSVTVDLGGGDGWALGDDLEATPAGEPTVALLPGLDPTTMGWKVRDWYLGGHGAALFDRNGNAGPTVWVDGRVIGAWAQRPDGTVATRLLEDLGTETAARVDAEAAALAAWLDGVRVTPRFRTPLERELAT